MTNICTVDVKRRLAFKRSGIVGMKRSFFHGNHGEFAAFHVSLAATIPFPFPDSLPEPLLS